MITDVLRKVLLGKKEKFGFERYREGLIDFNCIDSEIGLYIHIPFCRSLCPYCPYNKTLYKKEKAKHYKEALIKELNLYQTSLHSREVTSIYFGGGTPTLLMDEIRAVLRFIKDTYSFKGDIGIEIHPKEVSTHLLKELKELGVNLVSLGVQTFKEETLHFLGRGYGAREAEEAIKLMKEYDFQCIDIDIMTNLPGQSLEDIERDLRKVYSYGVDQVSIYPLIIFPMTKMDCIIKERGLSRFSELEEKTILQRIDGISKEAGYESSSIWTYSKDKKNRYTSVTRESFIGFGAGASSHFGHYFYLNTFDVDAYISSLEENRLPINIVNQMTAKEKMIYWIFWRCYEGVIDGERFYQLFQREMKREFRLLFTLLRILRMARKEGEQYILTQWGRFAYHFVEKQYSIYYLNQLWHRSMEQPWLENVEI